MIKWSFFFFFFVNRIESNANWALFCESNQLWIKCESIFFLKIESNANRFFKSNQFRIKCESSVSLVNQIRLEFFFFFCDSNQRCNKWPYKLIRWSYKLIRWSYKLIWWSYKLNQIRIKLSFSFSFSVNRIECKLSFVW